MCGIVGAVAKRNVSDILLEGLKRLEYRGYDSAGIVIIDSHHHFQRHRTIGKVKDLQKILAAEPLSGNIGIAHTRWATHGKPSEENAHPHIASNTIAIVHNGIIENHEVLRMQLLKEGCKLTSETDSELVAHLIYLKIKLGQNFLEAVRGTAAELEGAFAIGILHCAEPERLIALRRGSPLVIGLGTNENFIASDQMALLPVTQQFIYLEEGDIADIYHDRVMIYDASGTKTERPVHVSDLDQKMAIKGKYRHFMLKEIFEQPDCIISTLTGRVTYHHVLTEIFGIKAPEIFSRIRRIEIVACGTSYHSGLVAKYWLEEIAGIPCQVEIASENRYRQKVVEPDTLFVTISQSGETADTLAALRRAKTLGYTATLAICNISESTLARESDLTFLTAAGPEVGVASTKAFTTQLVALFLLTIVLGRFHRLDEHAEISLIKRLANLPRLLQKTLTLDPEITNLANDFTHVEHALFIGRGIQLPIAMEGALKLKEISYIHAEAYPAGELKHGPIALIDSQIPVIALAPMDELIDKLKSNLQEILARGGKLIVFADKETGIENNSQTRVITMPSVDKLLSPIVYAIPMQLLAYHVAFIKGTDIDQPRNLAKSVTVE